MLEDQHDTEFFDMWWYNQEFEQQRQQEQEQEEQEEEEEEPQERRYPLRKRQLTAKAAQLY
jgi:hypothetical protein